MSGIKGLYKASTRNCIQQIALHHDGVIAVSPASDHHKEVREALETLSIVHGWELSDGIDSDHRGVFLLKKADMELLLRGISNNQVTKNNERYLLLSYNDAKDAARLFGVDPPPLVFAASTVTVQESGKAPQKLQLPPKKELSDDERGAREAQHTVDQRVAAAQAAHRLTERLRARDRDPQMQALDRIIAARKAPSPKGRLP